MSKMHKNDIKDTAMILKLEGDILGLDLGTARTGVARMNTVARIAEPLNVLDMKVSDSELVLQVKQLVADYDACALVVGLPRNLSSENTAQTDWVEEKIALLIDGLVVRVFSLDEALTTHTATGRAMGGQAIDSVAAGIILEDFAAEVINGKIPNVTF